MTAAGEGHLDAVRTLLDRQANPNAVDSSGFRPLHYAAGGFWQYRQTVYEAIVRLLLVRGADPIATDARARCAVDLARTKGYQHVVTILDGHDR